MRHNRHLFITLLNRFKIWTFIGLSLTTVLFVVVMINRLMHESTDLPRVNLIKVDVNPSHSLIEKAWPLEPHRLSGLKDSIEAEFHALEGQWRCTVTDLHGQVLLQIGEAVDSQRVSLSLKEALYEDSQYAVVTDDSKQQKVTWLKQKISLPLQKEGLTVGFAIFEKQVQQQTLSFWEREGLLIVLGLVMLLWLLGLGLPILVPMKRPYKLLEEGLDGIGKGVLKSIDLAEPRGWQSNEETQYRQLIERYNGLIQELTRLLEKQNEEDSKRKAFLTIISHELKTPVATINAYVQGLVTGVAKDETSRQKYLKVIDEKMQRLMFQIEELFQYSQEESGRFKYHLEECYANDIFQPLFDQLANQSIHVVVVENYLPQVLILADAIRLEQVILNVFNNAVKHSLANQPILIRAYRQEQEVVIEIKDNGSGIDSKELPYIFDYYYQGNLSTQNDYSGIGLGLAICKEIVERHGGQIRVKSKLGQGTTMILILPIL